MSEILSGQVLVNNTDIWTTYGVFLTEDHDGGMDNLSAILTASETKEHTPVDIREENGEKYPERLNVANQARDVTLLFALYAPTKTEWFRRYVAFINFLKTGNLGWLNFNFPTLGLTLRMHYKKFPDKFKPLTYLWKEGVHAGRFKVTFREPTPII